MGAYNCFGQKIEKEITLVNDGGTGYRFEENDFYKVYEVPIKFNKTYTIAIDSPTGIIVKPLLKNSFGFIKYVWDEQTVLDIDTGEPKKHGQDKDINTYDEFKYKQYGIT